MACSCSRCAAESPLFSDGGAVVLLVTTLLGPQLDDPAVPLLLSRSSSTRSRGGSETFAGSSASAWSRWSPSATTVDAREHNISDVVFVATLLVPPYVFGRLVRRLAAQKALLEEREELVTREAVRAERDRIARELHDVIAHSVSAMVVQTAAAQDLVRTDPDRAEGVLRDVADTGRRALVETGRLLHVIRDDADELGLNPAPGVADLDRLVQEFRAEGLEVDLSVDERVGAASRGDRRLGLPDRAGGAHQRTALRQGDRHPAGDGPVTGWRSGRRNPTGPARPSMGSGLGLRGLAERVSLLGGTLTHGSADGHFELAATLPVEQA